MTSYMQPRSNLGGIARQPFRPGQWQGFKGATRNTTYIQNNFYGSSVFGANQNYGYYQPQPPCHQCDGGGDSEMPKWMKWMTGIGVGTSLLGNILKLFQKDKPEGGGATDPTPTRTTTPTPTPPETTTPPSAGTPPATTPTRTPTPPKEEGGGDNKYDCLRNGINMICRDASGRTSNIAGQVKVTPNADGSAPESFSITDTSSGQAHEYTYELTGTSADGKPIYTCKSMNGQAASTDNAYTLEITDGEPELVQYQNQSNYGSGLKFGSTATPTPPTPVATTPSTPGQQFSSVTPEADVTPTPQSNNQKNGSSLGRDVANCLVGFTTTSKKEAAIEKMKDINANNVVDFINGYNENKSFGDSIITQINTEYGWTDKEKLTAQKQIIEALYKKAKDNNINFGKENEKVIEDFLKSYKNIDSDDDIKTLLLNSGAKALDDIIDIILKNLKESEKTP